MLPLVVFLVLGATQLFLMLQARQLAQYAAFWAAREGSVTQASCVEMKRVTLKALLPAFSLVKSEPELEERVSRGTFRFDPREGAHRFSGDIFWLLRERPLQRDVTRALEERFDQGTEPMRLEVRLVFWYPLRIPFVNAAMVQMLRAAYGLAAYRSVNPLLPTADARWQDERHRFSDASVARAFAARTREGELVFPITVTSSMRMMTPPATEHFASQHCLP
ncbi:MAG: pilus assembly protein [Archangiaceae bacterium]|nr:pilus assembly protein [Archangiaceae bacterium]